MIKDTCPSSYVLSLPTPEQEISLEIHATAPAKDGISMVYFKKGAITEGFTLRNRRSSQSSITLGMIEDFWSGNLNYGNNKVLYGNWKREIFVSKIYGLTTYGAFHKKVLDVLNTHPDAISPFQKSLDGLLE
jgi:hypothetical protein